MGSYLWQNFLKDIKYIDFTLKRIEKYFLNPAIIEIWPWKWALTKKLINFASRIYLFEKDETFQDILQNIVWQKWELILWDFLEQDLQSFVANHSLDLSNVCVVGNLPYYITSPIFRKLFVENYIFKYWIFMIQKEVWEKIKTDAKDKSYLRRLVNYAYEVKYLKNVPAKAFNPAPKVDSCLVEFVWKNNKADIDFIKFQRLLDLISWFKRKTLSKISKILLKKDVFLKIPENLSSKRIQELDRQDMKFILKDFQSK